MRSTISTGAVLATLLFSAVAEAHFQEVIPNTDMVTREGNREVSLDLVFGHPMEDTTMEMAKPARFEVHLGGKSEDLLPTLESVQSKGHQAWKSTYKVKRPGDHVFYLEPAPYWEPSEGVVIVHHTKVVVTALGRESGWDRPIGAKAEIVPMVRPYGLWTGNVFQGVVLMDGEPVPDAKIEVEYLNVDGKVEIPGDAYVTQVITTDENGVFLYGIPKSGWWGFAALLDNDLKVKNPEGEETDVELGALIWIHARDMK